MASNAAADPLPPLVLKIVAVAEKTEDLLFEKQEEISNMEVGLEYTLQRQADLADQHEKASAAEKKHFLPELKNLKEQIPSMKKQLSTARGQATKMQHRINEIRQKARDTLREIREAEAKKAAKKSVVVGK